MKQRSKIAQPIVRYEVTIDEGLNAQQVNERKEHNLTNKVNKVVGKSYASIFLGNIFTFFNMLGLTIMILIFALGSYGNLFFSVVILSNTFIGIIQEIKAKRSIEKLSLLSAPIAKVVREGKECDIAVGDVVLDDVLQLETGKQIIADAIIMSGTIEVNEALLTGESAAIKKTVGDILLSGS
ncbi:MAG: cation-translocating P-type ATPase, partial [Clostridia bacterium]